MRRRAVVVALLAVLGGAACGGGAAVSVSRPPSAPQGGPVPAELAGGWTQIGALTLDLDLSGTSYAMGYPGTQAHGNVAVNGSEIDFYDGDACNMPLPAGIGKYRWTISASLLVFSHLNIDPCDRSSYLADPRGWHRLP